MDGSAFDLLLANTDVSGPELGLWQPRAVAREDGRLSADGSILYAEDFDVAESPAEPMPCDNAPPVLTMADIEAARLAGHAEGFADARSDADALRADLQLAALQSLADAMVATRREAVAVVEQRAQTLSQAILSVLSAALPHMSTVHAPAEVDAVLRAVMGGLKDEPVLRVNVHPDLEPCVHAAWRSLGAEGTSADIRIVGDPMMTPGDVIMSWADGRAVRRAADVWTALQAALAPLCLPDIKEMFDGV